jgi:ferredoxin
MGLRFPMTSFGFFKRTANRRAVLAAGQVVPDPLRCVQCGICTYNCPVGIDVRSHAWRGEPVRHSQCLTCGECVARCPRGVLRFDQTDLFAKRAE